MEANGTSEITTNGNGVFCMRAFIGHTIKVAVEVFGIVEGVLVDDRNNMILLRGKDGKITRVIKAGIRGFVPVDFEPVDYKPFLVLFCENKKSGCPGVQYIKEGEGFGVADIETFVGPCQHKCDECTRGSRGELRSINGALLSSMLSGAMFGEYPNKEKKNGGSGSATAIAKAAKSKGKG